MIKKNFFKRLICVILTILIVVPELRINPIKASATTFTTLLEKDPVIGIQFDDPEATTDVVTGEPDIYINTKTQKHNWWVLHNYDHLPYNEIHKRVQNNIWNNPDNNVNQGELTIYYEDGTHGFADIYRETDSLTYLWEVKPPSYKDKNKTKGLNQLKKYVESSDEYRYGSLSPGSVHDSSFSFHLTLDCTNGIENWEEYVTYNVEYNVLEKGLIVYDFTRSSVKKKKKKDMDSDAKSGEGNGSGENSDEDDEEGGGKPPIEISPGGKQEEDDEEEEDDDRIAAFVPVATVTFIVVAGGAALIYLSKVKDTTLTTLTPIIEKAVKACISISTSATAILLNSEGIQCYAVSAEDSSKIDDAVEALGLLDIREDDNYDENDEDEVKKKIKKKIKDKEKEYKEAEKQAPQRDPLIIRYSENDDDFLTTLEDGVNFDLDNNGFDEKTAWIGKENCFLALDVNGNGIIDNGSELFGDKFIMPNGNTSETGFEALRSLKTSKGDVINSQDPIFNELRLWFDENHNGKTDPGELKRLVDENIKEISLISELDGTIHVKTEVLEAEASNVTYNDGTTRKISEFWFPINSADTIHDGVSTVGLVPELSQALIEDKDGELSYLCEKFATATNICIKRYYLKRILYNITGSEEIDKNSRGGNIDARDLHVIEQFMGREFVGVDSSNPNSLAAEKLKAIYCSIEDMYYNYVNFSVSAGWFRFLTYLNKNDDGTKYIDTHCIDEAIFSDIENDLDVEVLLYDYGMYLKSLDDENDTSSYPEFIQRYSTLSNNYNKIFDYINNVCTIFGSENDDNIDGSGKHDFIFGDNGNDIINSGNGNDVIFGEYGNDILNGGAGNDTYIFGFNHGNDIVNDSTGITDIVFINGLSSSDYEISISVNGGVVLTNTETYESISLPDFLKNPLDYNFLFSDNQTIGGGATREVINGTDMDDYLDLSDGFNVFYAGDGDDLIAGGVNIDFIYGGSGNDTLLGRNGTNVMFGESGNDDIYDGDDSSYLNGGDGDDTLYGGGGADVLDGGTGNDYLQGDHGNDTYVFGKGYDIDTIAASSDLHTIIIHNYSINDMHNTREMNNDLVIDFGNETGDRIIVKAFFDFNANRDYCFIFDDGTVLGQHEITAKSAPIYGTEEDDYLRGTDENDTLDGITGNDSLCGYNGEDTYIFGKDYAHDIINEWGSDHSFVEFKDITSDEITVSNQWGSNLIISVNDTEDILTISNFKWGQASYTFKFADGAEGYVDKNTWELFLTKQPDPIEEDIFENTSVVSESDIETDIVNETVIESENTIEQNSDAEIEETSGIDTDLVA